MFRALESLADGFSAAAAPSGLCDGTSAAGSDRAAATCRNAERLSDVDANFAAQIATAVWIGNMTDAAAREALLSYAIACQLCDRAHLIRFREALIAEYAWCRERQDLVS